ncbi:NADPH:quinone oxidoreductase family protein [Methylobacterium sp. NEAU 140]|uniref:NADPH:quinone oxidoreductase family protein n=1 Tax=Methylobacterium sp. NEAU 140 TaxID=3064945 RepID=UPI0027339924|nr:NADPH:quinone oxidoreductase family protein [Methylobacterium sp. NEAU 140]MDP4025639.1 NADPH:quinone oxidoreductase family protein [Methylobacterium sp. NEAU 140]
MRALVCESLDGAEALRVAERPAPTPGPGQALVRMSLAALNFFDTLIVAGRYQVKPPLPFSPGGEGVGVIAALGERVAGLAIGQRVVVHAGHGCCAEEIAVDAKRLTPVPDGVPDEQAAGLTITYGTSLHALANRARVQPGEWLAVLGASGGVGLAAVELGALMGARVIACASSEEKLAAARAHGAEAGLVYDPATLKDELRRITGGAGVDVVYDAVGDAFAEPSLRALAWRGRYLVVGFAAGAIPKLPLNLILLKELDVQGVHWGAFTDREAAAHRADQERLLAWVAAGKLTAKVHGVYPLDAFRDAFGVLIRREAVGKVLIRV